MKSNPVESEWIESLNACDTLFVGYSGGLDSTVLLYALNQYAKLRNKLTAIHINHGLSPKADEWMQFCADTAKSLQISFQAFKPDFPKAANIEEEARNARYKIFLSLLQANDGLVLAHHANDQAETVLLHLIRGTGVEGLSAMPPEKKLGKGRLFRPLLHCSRETLALYAKEHGLSWIDDESNLDLNFSRNFLRHKVIPLLSERWPACTANINRTAEHCQQAATGLVALAEQDAKNMPLDENWLQVSKVLKLSRPRQYNLLRVWLKNNNLRPLSQKRLEQLAKNVLYARKDANPSLGWDGIEIRRFQDKIYILPSELMALPKKINWPDFPKSIAIEGLGVLVATECDRGLVVPDKAQIDIRFRAGGEKLRWRGQTKSLKKLMQEWGIPPWQRDRMPLVYADGQIAAVGSIAVSDDFYGSNASFCITIKLQSPINS